MAEQLIRIPEPPRAESTEIPHHPAVYVAGQLVIAEVKTALADFPEHGPWSPVGDPNIGPVTGFDY